MRDFLDTLHIHVYVQCKSLSVAEEGPICRQPDVGTLSGFHNGNKNGGFLKTFSNMSMSIIVYSIRKK